MTTTTTIATQGATTYIRKLCRHFAHKIATSYTETTGMASFEQGVCRMQATPDTLIFEIEAETPEAQETIKNILVRHLEKFAFREQLVIHWTS